MRATTRIGCHFGNAFVRLLQNFVKPLVIAERVQCAAVAVRGSTYEQLERFNPDLKHALD